jgi:tetratricopeptide (TPR) repeat protein
VLLAAVCLWIIVASGCVGPPGPSGGPLRISEITHLGDTRRQASMRLVVEGLDAELAVETDRALSRYQRAIQIDPGNPFAFLALARYYVSVDDPTRALEHLDRAQSLLEPDGSISLRVSPHLLGLRGAALEQMGRNAEAKRLLGQARQLAPFVWGDGRLDAGELR